MAELGPNATTYAEEGLVCSIDPRASLAGLDQLRAGGTAADAAVAASAVLAITTPHMCGMGGDLFALVHDETGPPAALVAAGHAGSGADPDRLRATGHHLVPFRGDVAAVPVPGCVDGWLALHERYGRRPLAEVLRPAIRLARDGFAVSGLLAVMMPMIRDVAGSEDLTRPLPRPGERRRRPGVAEALDAVVREGRAGFYGGAFGEGLLALGAGEYTPADLDRPIARWEAPLGVAAFGHDLWTVPPPSQGYLSLAAAWISDGLGLPDDPDDPLWAHLLCEASKQAAWDRPDVLHDGADGEALLATDRLSARRRATDPNAATALLAPAAGGDTIYLCAVDAEGRGVSLIQSNAADFGAHLAEPTTGILLHNRGVGFSLRPGHPAEYGPGRRPPSTLAPALVTTADGRLAATVGTMGGDVQPQTVLQLLARLLHAGQPPGTVVSAPRWRLQRAGDRGFDLWGAPADVTVAIEADAPAAWTQGLSDRGHRVVAAPARDHGAGHAHVIAVTGSGTLAGASDPRCGTPAALGC